MTITDDWYGLYRAGWKNLIVDDAFQHPAKFARNLIKQIYDHCLVCHWLEAGDTVVDPFGGVALGGLDAMRLGLNWTGVELEPKFVDLGNRNIALWNQRYGDRFMRWGTARLLQGDSRRLLEVIAGADAAISSPPYADGARHTGGGDPHPEHIQGGELRYVDYGITPGQLAALREGDLDAAISSPPFGEAQTGGELNWEHQEEKYKRRFTDRSKNIGYRADKHGATPGNLGNLRADDDGFAAAVSSPPYNPPMSQDHNGTRGGKRGHTPAEPGAFARYGNSPGQLEGMSMDGFDAAMSSPPYEGSLTQGNNPETYGQTDLADIGGGQLRYPFQYGSTSGQLGAESGDTFWSAARVIVAQTFAALRPGGHAVWVVKAFVRDGKRVEFPAQWRQLCESVGFVTLHVHRAWLVEDHGAQLSMDGNHKQNRKERKSFFRRLSEAKAQAAVYWPQLDRASQARYLWESHNDLWADYNRRVLEPFEADVNPPVPATPSRIRSAAQLASWIDAGRPFMDIETRIDYETIICMEKPGA